MRGQDEATAVVWAGFKAKLQATVEGKLHRALFEQLCAEAGVPRLLAKQEVAKLQGSLVLLPLGLSPANQDVSL